MPEINTTFNPLSYIALFLFFRWLSGVTMDGWTANVSWVWPEFCWRSWTSAQWWLAGTSFSLPPPWWTQRWRRWSATLPRCHWRAPSGHVVSDHKTHANMQRIGINLKVQTDLENYHTSINDFTDWYVNLTVIRRMYCILLIFYQAVSLSLTGDTFLLLLPLTTPQTRRKILPSSDLFDEKTEIFLMRILQRGLSIRNWSHRIGTTVHSGLGYASATRLPHSPHLIPIPRTACCLAALSLGASQLLSVISQFSIPKKEVDWTHIILDTNILICRCIATEEDF